GPAKMFRRSALEPRVRVAAQAILVCSGRYGVGMVSQPSDERFDLSLQFRARTDEAPPPNSEVQKLPAGLKKAVARRRLEADQVLKFLRAHISAPGDSAERCVRRSASIKAPSRSRSLSPNRT